MNSLRAAADAAHSCPGAYAPRFSRVRTSAMLRRGTGRALSAGSGDHSRGIGADAVRSFHETQQGRETLRHRRPNVFSLSCTAGHTCRSRSGTPPAACNSTRLRAACRLDSCELTAGSAGGPARRKRGHSPNVRWTSARPEPRSTPGRIGFCVELGGAGLTL